MECDYWHNRNPITGWIVFRDGRERKGTYNQSDNIFDSKISSLWED